MEEDYFLKTDGLVKWFPIRGGMFSRTKTFVRAVDGVSLGVRRGETFGLVGESGCGKTTLGRTVMRLTDPSKGTISFEGEDISRIKGRNLKRVRRRMQMVFQDPYASLDPRQSVRSALLEPMKIHHTVSSKGEANRHAEELIEKVGLNPDHLARFPHEFSGGQRQRIAIATALAVRPSFIILDEPTSSLDVSVQAQILKLLKDIQNDMGLTYGREILGVPKKLSVAKLEHSDERVFGHGERPAGVRLFTVGIAMDYAVKPAPRNAPVPAAVALRLIDQPRGAEAGLCGAYRDGEHTRCPQTFGRHRDGLVPGWGRGQ